MTVGPTDHDVPDISFVMPCFNEEDVLDYTIPHLVKGFSEAGINVEIVAVDNGSTDRTGEVLRRFADEGLPVVPHRVEVNIGYGNGNLQGIPLCRAPWIGFIPADGQIDAEDVVRLFQAARHAGDVIAKARRRFRLDGFRRKLVSVTYNLFVLALWPKIGSLDINGTPKLMPRRLVETLEISSTNWFFDPEIMIKSYHLGVRVLEMNVFARMRGSGVSHVRASTCWEFFRELLRYRFTGVFSDWLKKIRSAQDPALVRESGAPPDTR